MGILVIMFPYCEGEDFKMAKLIVYLSNNFERSLGYNSHLIEGYGIESALKCFDENQYRRVKEFTFTDSPSIIDELICDNAFFATQNIDSNWNNPACRSSSVGDIFVIERNNSQKIYIVASFGYDLLAMRKK